MFLLLALAAVAPPPDSPAGDPFDLHFVPSAAPTRLVGVRPCLLGPLAGPAQDDGLAEVVSQLVTWFGGRGDAGRLPPLADINQVLGEGFTLSLPSAAGPGTGRVVNDWYVIRTAAPFDWAGLAAAWFPAGEMREHAGFRYRHCTQTLPADSGAPADAEPAVACFWAADDRTLLFAFGEDAVRRVIDRHKAGDRVRPLPLWAAVERCPVAVAATLADHSWLTVPDELPADRPALRPFADLLRSAGELAVGLSVTGDRLRVTAAASAADLDGLTAALGRSAARIGPHRVWRSDGVARAVADLTLADVTAYFASRAADD